MPIWWLSRSPGTSPQRPAAAGPGNARGPGPLSAHPPRGPGHCRCLMNSSTNASRSAHALGLGLDFPYGELRPNAEEAIGASSTSCRAQICALRLVAYSTVRMMSWHSRLDFDAPLVLPEVVNRLTNVLVQLNRDLPRACQRQPVPCGPPSPTGHRRCGGGPGGGK